MESDVNIEQPENALASIFSSSEGDSKIIEDRAKQSRKHSLPSNRTVFGIQIDLRETHEKNPLVPIRFRCDIGANVIAESDSQFAKQLSSRDSIDEGTQNDVRERLIMSLSLIIVITAGTDETEGGETLIQCRDDRCALEF
jgi:hypothetical protein